ncbi:hypothetical protein ACFJI1_14805 [Pseudoxanthomonas sp. UC29_72]
MASAPPPSAVDSGPVAWVACSWMPSTPKPGFISSPTSTMPPTATLERSLAIAPAPAATLYSPLACAPAPSAVAARPVAEVCCSTTTPLG